MERRSKGIQEQVRKGLKGQRNGGRGGGSDERREHREGGTNERSRTIKKNNKKYNIRKKQR